MSAPRPTRDLFEDEHVAFRAAVQEFIEREVAPHHATWSREGCVSRELWQAAGKAGFLGMDMDERYGGGGITDFRYNAILTEELSYGGWAGVAIPLFNDIVAPYFNELCDEHQKRRWLPGLCSGDLIGAIAMTEPGAGSDLQGLRTTAVDKGDRWVVNGSKTFISNGILGDLVVVVARTDPDAGSKGFTLLVVERGMAGFERGRNLDKLGQHAQDTAELFFDGVEVPKANVLGGEGRGFGHLMRNLAQERLSIGVSAAAACERSLDLALGYAQGRQAFGQSIGSFQHTKFLLAEMATEARVVRVFLDDCIRRHLRGELDTATASMAKWWSTELQKRFADQALQVHGGYGYMTEYAVALDFVDGRIATIYGGTTEIQKEIIGRSLGL